MDEGTIYNPEARSENGQQADNPPVQPVPAPQPQAPLPEVTVLPTPGVTAPSGQIPPAPPAPEKKSTFSGKAIKIILGVFALIFLLVTVLLLVSKFTHKSSSTQGPVSLTYWGLVDESKVDSQIKGFEAENPQIKINYIKQDSSDYVEKVKVRIPNGNGPDVYMLDNSWMPVLSSYLSPLPQSVITSSKFDESYYPVAKTDLIKNGAVYAVPLNTDVLSLFINTSLLPAGSENNAPGTWQEFVNLAQGATKRDDQGKITVAGAGIGAFDNVTRAQYLMALLFAQNGVDYSKISDYQDRISQALTFYTDFAQVENSVWDQNQDNSLQAFTEGKVAMYFGFATDIDSIKAQKADLSFRVAPVPQLTSDNPKSVANYFAQGVSTGTSHQKEALLFVKYTVDHPANIGQLSADKNSSVSTDANLSTIQNAAKSAVSSPYAADQSEKSFNAKLIDSLRQTVNSVLSGGSADDGAAQIIKDYTSAISSLQTATSGK